MLSRSLSFYDATSAHLPHPIPYASPNSLLTLSPLSSGKTTYILRSAIWSSATNVVAVGRSTQNGVALRSSNGGFSWAAVLVLYLIVLYSWLSITDDLVTVMID
jgi:hypothetical protein